ncbi:hypothetical protein B0T26DRAFT_700420 [Lasiosphaeria miniovina]|uniref:Uncharacterized protein n=1 Tax=Lasiosphaeria miniovina TaxID=1954250 RepID=A0AA40DZV0_9PEZI|nr:uncharacterized protein B0T26DRAFT_700420 [Lasiosphaeria miniovina]KAK0721835.1 hypothetical protein B0T26DRAFT_700420 [Lasiosphaeria miniovina]
MHVQQARDMYTDSFVDVNMVVTLPKLYICTYFSMVRNVSAFSSIDRGILYLSTFWMYYLALAKSVIVSNGYP